MQSDSRVGHRSIRDNFGSWLPGTPVGMRTLEV
jgi:hypothetical protein